MRDSSQDVILEAYEKYAEAIYRHCFFRIYSKARAEELMQETFMKAFEYLTKGEKVENIRAFLYRVANNLVIDEMRKKKEESLDAILAGNRFAEPVSDEQAKMEQMALFKEITSALHRLPEEERQIIVWRYINELEPQEIAEILGVTANAASVRLHRAMAALRKIAEPESAE